MSNNNNEESTIQEVKKAEVIVSPKEYGVEEDKASTIVSKLNVQDEINAHIEEYNIILSANINDHGIHKEARQMRLNLQKVRTQILKPWHEKEKEIFLRGGQFVDAIRNKYRDTLQEMESKMSDIEKHAENLEKERIEKLKKEREESLTPYVDDVEIYGNLGEMADEVWEGFLNNEKTKFEEQKKKEEETEKERIRIEKRDKIGSNRLLEYSKYSLFTEKQYSVQELGDMEDGEFNEIIKSIDALKVKKDKEDEKNRKELEKLKEEARQKREKKEKREKELEPYSRYGNVLKLIDLEDKKYEIEFTKLKEVAKKSKIEEDKAQKEREKILEKQKEEEEALKIEKEKREKLKQESIDTQMIAWIDSFECPEIPESLVHPKTQDIVNKFNQFKSWAKSEL